MKPFSILLLLVALAGCQGLSAPAGQPGGAVEQDGPPTIPHGDLTKVPDPVPRQEVKSKRGNPDTYEVFGKEYSVMDSASGYRAEGNASWYGQKFHGRTTSSGEPFDMFELTAAHRTLPIPSYAQVTNLANNTRVMVRINDRGPFHDDRILDLSYAAAVKLGFHDQGTARVLVEVVAPALDEEPAASLAVLTPQPKYSAEFLRKERVSEVVEGRPETSETSEASLYLQAGAFRHAEGAARLAAQIREALAKGGPVTNAELVQLDPNGLYLVRIGPVEDRALAQDLRQRLVDAGFAPPLILP